MLCEESNEAVLLQGCAELDPLDGPREATAMGEILGIATASAGNTRGPIHNDEISKGSPLLYSTDVTSVSDIHGCDIEDHG